MPEFIQNYNFSIISYGGLLLYIFLCSTWRYSIYEYCINIIIFSKLYLLNYTSILIVINLIGLYLFLKKISFEVQIKMSIK